MEMTVECDMLDELTVAVLTESRNEEDVVMELCSIKGTGQLVVVIYESEVEYDALQDLYTYLTSVEFHGKTIDEVIKYFQ